MTIYGISENSENFKEFKRDLLNSDPKKVIEKYKIERTLFRSDGSGGDNLEIGKQSEAGAEWRVPTGSAEERRAMQILAILIDPID